MTYSIFKKIHFNEEQLKEFQITETSHKCKNINRAADESHQRQV